MRERIGNGILTPLPAFDYFDRLQSVTQILGWPSRERVRKRHHQIRNPIARQKCIDAMAKDRPPAERQELLGLRAAEAGAETTGRNDGADVHRPRNLTPTVRPP